MLFALHSRANAPTLEQFVALELASLCKEARS